MPGASGGRGHEQQTQAPEEQQAHGGARGSAACKAYDKSGEVYYQVQLNK